MSTWSSPTPQDDDGRTIADMSAVRGGMRDRLGGLGRKDTHGAADALSGGQRDFSDELQDAEEQFAVIRGTLKAALSIATIYIFVFGVVIALLIALWT